MDQAPWWFASAMTLLGVALGVILKGALDARTEKARHRREDDLRQLEQQHEDELRLREQRREDAQHFLEERRQAYTRFYRAATKASGADYAASVLDHVHRATSHGDDDVYVMEGGDDADTIARALETVEKEQARTKEVRSGALDEIYEALAVVAVVSPRAVSDAAEAYQHALIDRDPKAQRAAIEDFLKAARQDLGRDVTE